MPMQLVMDFPGSRPYRASRCLIPNTVSPSKPPFIVSRRIKVIYKKLRNYWGWADHNKFAIEIHVGLKGKKKLEVLIHEATHLCSPEATEQEVVRISTLITRMLWKEGVRFVDNTDEHDLQDGKK
jgi:hypothetical protein